MSVQLYHDTSSYEWDLRVRDACAEYQRTRRIDELLIAGFSQHGRWHGLRQRSNGVEFPAWLMNGLQAETIPKNRLERVSETGEFHLLSSYVDDRTGEVHLPWHSVGGAVHLEKAAVVRAPNLRVVGGEVVAWSATEIEIPCLERIEESLWAGAVTELHAPKLTSVGGLYLAGAATIHAPDLGVVNGEFLARSAGCASLPKLAHVLADLNLDGVNDLSLPALRQVEGAIQADRAKRVSSPELARVAGYVSCNRARSIHAPCLVLAPHEISAPHAREFIRVGSGGERILHASIRNEGKIAVRTDFTHIHGDLLVPHAKRISAPNLVSLSGSLEADEAIAVDAPSLRWVGGDLITESAPDFFPAQVLCGGEWVGHPEARKRWAERQARHALRDGPGFEL
ncbi:MAG: hypothetical protein H7A49_08120 [Akkermansiaceae bacterium]|nr:hypothetical protein [Akkermansiaceae bacterium]